MPTLPLQPRFFFFGSFLGCLPNGSSRVLPAKFERGMWESTTGEELLWDLSLSLAFTHRFGSGKHQQRWDLLWSLNQFLNKRQLFNYFHNSTNTGIAL